MFKEKRCPRCNGSKYLILRGKGPIEGFLHSSKEQDHWFCPTCDWGRDEDFPSDLLLLR